MVAGPPPANDHIPSLEGMGDKGAGQMPNIDIRDLNQLGGFLSKMFGPAEQSVAKLFGDASQMLPFTNHENQQV
jgi:hypothetical protein